MTKYDCKFRFYYKNVLTSYVVIENGIVKSEKYTDKWWELPFGMLSDNMITKSTISVFFEQNCFPEHKIDLNEQLEAVGLDKYDPFEICRVTGGRMAGSHYSMEFIE